MEKIIIETQKTKEIIDITDQLNKLLKKHPLKERFCHLFLMHTTAALTTAYLDPESELDVFETFQTAIPISLASRYQEHEHAHFTTRLPSHIIASFLGPSLSIPVKDGKLLLGKLQRAVLVELNGPRTREILVDI